MAIRIIKANAPEWFTPSSQKGAAEPSQFKVRGLTGYEQAVIAPEVTMTKGNLTFSAPGITMIFRFALSGWRGIVDDTGEPVEFERTNDAGEIVERTPREIQDLLHYNDQIAICSEVFARSFVNAGDKKK